jgi:DNA gyrase subunit B
MVGMLSDCISSNPSLSELFIVWSEEAKTTAKAERDRMTQAVLRMPKDFDPEADLADLLDHDVLRGIIASTGIGLSFPADLIDLIGPEHITYDQLRYHKVIITLLPGEEGRNLVRKLLNFMYHYQRPLIQMGHIYAAEEALDEDCSTYEFAEKVLNKETRHLKQVEWFDTWLETLAAFD